MGTSVAGRNHRDTENLIGFFLNALALRTGLSGDPTFSDVLRRVKDTVLDAMAHQDVPSGSWSRSFVPNERCHTSPSSVLLGMQNTPEEEPSLPGLRLRSLEGAA